MGSQRMVPAHSHTRQSDGGGVLHANLTGLSADDHPQYGAVAQDESITGAWDFQTGRLRLKRGTDATKPSTGNVEGDVYWATDTDKFYVWDGAAWLLVGPGAAGAHDLDGTSHTRSARVTDGGGVVVNIEASRVRIDDTVYDIGAGSLTLAFGTNYVFINSSGVYASNTTGFPADSIPLAVVVVGAGVMATDNFDRANDLSLGSNWFESENATTALSIDTNNLFLRSGDVGPTPTRGYGKYDAVAFGADQYSQLKVITLPPNIGWSGPGVRLSGTYLSFTGYAAIYRSDLGAVKLYKWVAADIDAPTEIGSWAGTLAANDVVKIEAIGSTIKVYVNGVQQISVTDAAVASGKPGAVVMSWTQSQSAYIRWDDFEGADIDIISITDKRAFLFEKTGAGGGGGAPVDAEYVVTTANATLTAEKVLGTDVIMKGTLAARPAAGVAGRLYFITDAGSERLTRDNGTAWEDIGEDWDFVTGKPTSFTPSAHKSTHVSGGSDAFAAADLLEAVVKRLRESGGPTDLTVGAIADGEFLKRSGATIVGGTPGGGGGSGTPAPEVMVRVKRSTVQSIPSGVNTVIAFDAEDYDTDNMHDVVTNNSRITFQRAGKYGYWIQADWASNTTSYRRLFATKNGGAVVIPNIVTTQPPSAAVAMHHGFYAEDTFVAGDYIEFFARQDTGGALNLNPVAGAHRIAGGPIQWKTRNLRITNGATMPTAQVTVTADEITIEDEVIAVAVNVTADITVSGVNGLDTGAEAASTWYAVWLIYNPTTSTVASLLSTNFTSPTMPAGYTKKRRVGAVRNNSASNFFYFEQLGEEVRYLEHGQTDQVIVDGVAGNTVFQTVSAATVMPTTAREFRAFLLLLPGTAPAGFYTRPTGHVTTVGQRVLDYNTTLRFGLEVMIRTNGSQSFDWREDTASGASSVYIIARGYLDPVL